MVKNPTSDFNITERKSGPTCLNLTFLRKGYMKAVDINSDGNSFEMEMQMKLPVFSILSLKCGPNP